MTTLPSPTFTEALAPVREALLARAHADADRVRGSAEASVAEAMAMAQAEADEIRARAHDEAFEQARSLRAAEEAHGRRKAREVVLAAQRAAYDGLVDRARREVRALLDDPAVIDVLSATAREQEGADAEVMRTEGGVAVLGKGPHGGRRVEFSLDALADQAIAELLRARASS